MSRRRQQDEPGMNMTPMIDVVFQLMIFFLVTFKVDKDQINEDIRLAMAPHGPAIEDKKDPRTVIIEVDRKGHIMIGRNRLTQVQLQGLMHTAVQRSGFGIPVIVRADAGTRHEDVRRVMDACSSIGLWRIKFAAVKEEAPR